MSVALSYRCLQVLLLLCGVAWPLRVHRPLGRCWTKGAPGRVPHPKVSPACCSLSSPASCCAPSACPPGALKKSCEASAKLYKKYADLCIKDQALAFGRVAFEDGQVRDSLCRSSSSGSGGSIDEAGGERSWEKDFRYGRRVRVNSAEENNTYGVEEERKKTRH